MRKIGIFFILSIAALAAACGSTERASNAASNSSASWASYPRTAEVADASPAAFAANANTSVTSTTAAGAQRPRRETVGQSVVRKANLTKAEEVHDSEYTFDRKVVRNADLDLEAASPEEAQRRITSIAESNGGFVVESQQNTSDIKSKSRDVVTMTLRVPSDKFGQTLDEIRGVADRVVTETVKGQDVTEEFIDIEAQLKAKKGLEAQFMEIMKRATTIDSALDVQSQLADVRGEIERIEGRKRFLENQSSLSTIKLRVQTPRVIAAAAASTGFAERLGAAFNNGLDVAATFVLALLTFAIGVLPFAVFVGLPGFIAFRYLWRRHSRPRSISEIAAEEIKDTGD
ncbi:MAG: DUF4349 domain-containing protein [Pyrinomonadaceae bacterium]